MKRPAAKTRIGAALADVELFKALADPSRANLLQCVIAAGGNCSVTEAASCCDLDFSVVSRHLQTLARAGWLRAQKDGRKTIYTVTCAELAQKLRELADTLEACCPAPPPPEERKRS